MAGGNKGGGGEQEPRKTAAGTLGGELDAADASDPYGSEVFSADIAEGVFTAQAQAVYDDVRMHAPEAMAPEHLQLDDVPNLDELPEDFAVRTLIASAAPRRKPASSEAHKVAQQVAPAVAPRRVPIEVKNVAAELKDDRLVMHLAPKSARAAAFRMLRYKLVERGHPRTVAVTSAEPRDGKTTCAANLALA